MKIKVRQQGFTVIELVVLTAVIMIFASITAYNMYASIDQYNLSYDAQQIANNLKLARMRAVFLAKDLNFTFANGSYGLDPNDPTVPRQSLPSETLTPAVGSIPTLAFSSTGMVSQDLTITLTNQRKQAMKISITKSGQVTVSLAQ